MRTILYLILACCTACTQVNQDSTEIIEPDSIPATVEPVEAPIPPQDRADIKVSDLMGKVFTIGNRTHFTDSCTFYFECDCCSGELLFTSDSSFHYVGLCMSDITLSSGFYLVEDKILTLHFSGYHISSDYNWEREIDSSLVEYIISDTIQGPHSLRFYSDLCNENIKLILLSEENIQVGIISNTDYKSSIDKLANRNLL